jgi:hypothetical protein
MRISILNESIPDMRSEHSRLAFAALDNVMSRHYMECMRQEIPMTFQQAIAVLTETGATLLEALEDCENILENEGEEGLTQEELTAFRVVCAKMRPLFIEE